MLMPIFGIKFRELGQTSYYSGPPELKRGDHVLIEADQGLTLAEVVSGPLEGLPGMEEQDLPDILRQAGSTDLETGRENDALAREATAYCRQCIRDRRLDMKLVDVEVFFDRSKLIFYFTAPARIDFRDLVKDLVREYAHALSCARSASVMKPRWWARWAIAAWSAVAVAICASSPR